MTEFEMLMGQVAALPYIHSILHGMYGFLQHFAVKDLSGVARRAGLFLLMGMGFYYVATRDPERSKSNRFSYPQHAIPEPGNRFSFLGVLKYVFPKAIYSHSSFRIDLLWAPVHFALQFFGLFSAAIGAWVVQGWLLHHFGHSAISIPEGTLAIVLQAAIILLARDFGRFMWHYQAHTVPFFWEFHKGHHSAEVLHPFGVRNHPVDYFIRNFYRDVGGGLIAGSIIYVLGMNFSAASLAYVAGWLAVFNVLEIFEHTHIRFSFGKTLDRILYVPWMHTFHHGAAPEHMNVNLGITGGLMLWDHIFGTAYYPKGNEKIIWGASLNELGANNPHRTMWGFISGPFVGAARVLRPRVGSGVMAPVGDAQSEIS
jgi:sterol desaturase/sphingolipid hydroxylase (fatty acid hydroxylase superfamily)